MTNYLEVNLIALKKVNPMLAEVIEKDNTNYSYLVLKHNQETDFTNLFIQKPNKIHSAYGIDKQLENINKEVEKLSLEQDGGTIVIGIGLGHFINVICNKKNEKHVVVIVETIPKLLNETFRQYDFSKYIKNGTFLIACPDQIELQMVMGLIELNCVIKDWNLISEPYTALLPDKYSEITIYANDLLNQIRCNTGTVMGNGKIIAQNDIKNLPYILSSWGINKFENMFKDKPAVVVSTGPSLRKNIHLLKSHRDKVIIICVAQALRILLSYDIVPDFACTVDFGEINYEHFKGLFNCNVPLIALNRVYYKVLQEWKGPKIICTTPSNPENKNTMSYLANYGYVEQGGSVSHMAVGSAIKLGCNPIILIGQDLAYENNLSHNPNADASGTVEIKENGLIEWKVNDPNSILKDQVSCMGSIQEVDGYLEKTVQTNIGLLSFITSFEHIFKRYMDIKFINSTEGGANLKGAKNLALRDALKKYCLNNVYRKHIHDMLKVKPDLDLICKEVIDLLKIDKEELEEIIKNSNDAIIAIDQATKYYNAKRKFNKYLNLNSEFSNKAHELTKKNDLLSIAIYYANRAIYAKELYVNGGYDHIKKDKADYLTRVKRNKLILDAVIKEAEELIKLYEIAVTYIDSIIVYGDDKYILENTKLNENNKLVMNDTKTLTLISYNLDDVEEYFKKNNFSHPYLESIKALNYIKDNKILDKDFIKRVKEINHKAILMRKDTIDEAEKHFIENKIRERITVKELIELSMQAAKEKDYVKSMDYIKKAHLLLPNNELVLWGLATINLFMKNIDESLNFYKILISKYPHNYRYQYEYGNVLLNVEPEEGIKNIMEVMSKTTEFDHFFKHIGKYYYLKSDFEKAATNYQSYVDKFPADYEAMKTLADCYRQLKDHINYANIAIQYEKLTGDNLDDGWYKNSFGEVGKDLK
jgi:hypothetical protein